MSPAGKIGWTGRSGDDDRDSRQKMKGTRDSGLCSTVRDYEGVPVPKKCVRGPNWHCIGHEFDVDCKRKWKRNIKE
ncbi:hypothetical protein E2C01_006133 [Portunus trituberculatus]|uniref:Uncharacterized protein n=1 Tax=Portunus trituberculatus TaxID=210409 RepID=A0A5B7CVI9_PORTR|nr:hypothetical protein [Portunus trituberculatus]